MRDANQDRGARSLRVAHADDYPSLTVGIVDHPRIGHGAHAEAGPEAEQADCTYQRSRAGLNLNLAIERDHQVAGPDRAIGVGRDRRVVVAEARKACKRGSGLLFSPRRLTRRERREPVRTCLLRAGERGNSNERVALRPQSAMAAHWRKGAALFITGERTEIYGYMRDGMVGTSGAPSRKGGLVARQLRSWGRGRHRISAKWIGAIWIGAEQTLCAWFTGREARRRPWPGDNESRPSRYQQNRQPRSGRRPLADGV
jgi:hypothetical protein